MTELLTLLVVGLFIGVVLIGSLRPEKFRYGATPLAREIVECLQAAAQVCGRLVTAHRKRKQASHE